MLVYRKKKKKADTFLGKLDDQIRTKEKLKGPGTCGVGKKRDQGRRGREESPEDSLG